MRSRSGAAALSALLLLVLACGHAAAERRLLQTDPTPAAAAAAAAGSPAPVKPRWPLASIVDRGYGDLPHGWYDAQCQGAANDYCRFVGDRLDGWWSCALAGSTNPITPKGQYTFRQMRPEGMPCNLNPLPRWNLTAITDLGVPGKPAGWYDAQCQGVANDYCRFRSGVWSESEDGWSCALAGSSSEHTEVGQFRHYLMEPDVPCKGNPIKPRVDVKKLRYPGKELIPGWGTFAMWYDIQAQGAANDYCRVVPAEAAPDNQLQCQRDSSGVVYCNPPSGPSKQKEEFWSCALAGAAEEVSPPDAITQPLDTRDVDERDEAGTPRRGYTVGLPPELAGIRYETDYASGIDGRHVSVSAMRECCTACAASNDCTFWVFSRDGRNSCVLKAKQAPPADPIANPMFKPSALWDTGDYAQCAHLVPS